MSTLWDIPWYFLWFAKWSRTYADGLIALLRARVCLKSFKICFYHVYLGVLCWFLLVRFGSWWIFIKEFNLLKGLGSLKLFFMLWTIFNKKKQYMYTYMFNNFFEFSELFYVEFDFLWSVFLYMGCFRPFQTLPGSSGHIFIYIYIYIYMLIYIYINIYIWTY